MYIYIYIYIVKAAPPAETNGNGSSPAEEKAGRELTQDSRGTRFSGAVPDRCALLRRGYTKAHRHNQHADLQAKIRRRAERGIIV